MEYLLQDFACTSELGPGMSQDRIALNQGGVQALVYRGVHPDPDLDMFFKQFPGKNRRFPAGVKLKKW